MINPKFENCQNFYEKNAIQQKFCKEFPLQSKGCKSVRTDEAPADAGAAGTHPKVLGDGGFASVPQKKTPPQKCGGIKCKIAEGGG